MLLTEQPVTPYNCSYSLEKKDKENFELQKYSEKILNLLKKINELISYKKKKKGCEAI